MMVGKIPVDLGVEREVLARQLRHQRLERGAGGAVARVPADPKSGQPLGGDAVEADQQTIDVILEDLARLDGAGAVGPIAFRRHPADRGDVLAEERPALKYHLEAVVIGGIVAASYLNAAIHLLG